MITVPLIFKFVFSAIANRVTEDIREEIEIFEELLDNNSHIKSKLALRNQEIQYPKNAVELANLFNIYLSRRIPEDDTYLIGILNEEFYRSSPEALPKILQPESSLMQSLIKINTVQEGIKLQPNTITGNILYIVKPIRLQEQIIGRLIVAHAVRGEQEEAFDTLKIVFWVMISVFILSVVVTWFMAGKVLSPLNSIISTAIKITDTNLNERIEVQTSGELAELANSFNAMMNRLEAAFVSQRHFINDVGHELRTPITIIRGHLELIDLDQASGIEQETINLVIDEIDRMSRLVDDLSLLAKSERPDFLLLETIDAQSFLDTLSAKVQALANRSWQFQVKVKGILVGDRQRLTQAIMNLAQNAVQHTREFDCITLGASLTNGEFRIWVQDTGEGIDLCEQERIFERFARVKNSHRRSDGSGLGLSIVRGIVEAHRGLIKLQSQPGRGSTFLIVIPLNPLQE
ncbi:sensor histidine kinase [Nodularia sp. UHCC 0506]|uniref:sensor histidine kinase n=1 Tax=Nodularia sp. UHCC 0506 TaxID=3110243 RepID=UPI002B20FDDA|nr:ATP-binding protein [Nodularia sp. UHCC 0506]MEA5514817.1 ATP-binding protein [Nodularia sp. UHCC 0506]